MSVREQVSIASADGTALSREAADGLSSTASAESASRTPGPGREPFGLAAGWWPVSFGSELGDSPRGVRLGAREVVAYRDQAGAAHTLADQCPHRRLPLSMGLVIPEGLQCGYHGWTFDGTSGQCTLIPNLRPAEKPSGRIRVPAYPVVEADGFVFVWTGPGPADPMASPLPALGAPAVPYQGRTIRGVAKVRAPHARLSAALLVNPGAALGLSWLLGGGGEVLGPEVTVDTSGVTARRHRLVWNLPRVPTFDPVSNWAAPSTVATVPATGMTVAVADAPVGGGTVRIVIGLTPTGLYRTTVRWRIEAHTEGACLVTEACRWVGAARRLARRVARALEAAADAVETVTDPAVDRLREVRAAAVGEELS